MRHTDGNHCPRCVTGLIYMEYFDYVCLNCGYRSMQRYNRHDYLTEVIVSRLIRNSQRVLDDVDDKYFRILT